MPTHSSSPFTSSFSSPTTSSQLPNYSPFFYTSPPPSVIDNTTISYASTELSTILTDSQLLYNTTENYTDVLLGIFNGSDLGEVEGAWSYCSDWLKVQHNLYQAANIIMAAAFMVPATFKQSVLIVRVLLVISHILLICWTSNALCAPDMLTWNILFGLINFAHMCSLIKRFRPPTLNVELTELYLKVFQPLRVSKKHFKELVKEAQIATLEKGDIYAVEDGSPADERLSILISGKLRVTCDDTHLHFINTHQFVDSPEWEANHEQSDDVFQVTITAEEDAVYLCWPRMRLERVLRHRPILKVVLDCIIGKDITQKLYSLNDHLCGLDIEKARIKRNEIHEIWLKATRSMSMDAVFTGTTGKVRSTFYRSMIKDKDKKNPFNTSSLSINDVQHNHQRQQRWIPIVANHFPAEYPFAGLKEYNAQLAVHNAALLAQDLLDEEEEQRQQALLSASLLLPQTEIVPPTPLRTRSFIRRPREVKFEDALMT